MLPSSLAAFAAHRRFILWRLSGGTKHPISPLTGLIHDAHDIAHHVTYDEAVRLVGPLKCSGVAYVFTSAEKFFFVDIDKCRVGNSWSPVVEEVLAYFPGAAVEVSTSENGLHVFGMYTGDEPIHGCKNKELGLELYTSGRFVALTGLNAIGNVATDHTLGLRAFINKYFPGDASVGTPGTEAWEDRASSEWAGPESDSELLALMFAARPSIGQVLSNKATPAQLYNRDVAALTVAYPDVYNNPPRAYDESSADAALASHLAFWTGRNTERIRRLMLSSALIRPKWEKHRGYLWSTISKACFHTKDVYKQRQFTDRAPVIDPSPQGTPVASAVADMRQGQQWLTATAQLEHFKGCIYIRDMHEIFVPDGALLDQKTFRVDRGGYMFAMDSMNEKLTANAWEAFTESRAYKFPKVDTTCFRPELQSGLIIREENRTLVNVYVPVETERMKGDASPFILHLTKLFPDSTDFAIVLAYLAAMVQYPGVKFQWCPLIQGAEGNGKTVLTRCISFAVGHRYTHLPNAKALGDSGSTFNAWIRHRLFIGVEEISFRERADIFEALKPLITNDRTEIQPKGVDQYTGDNRANFLMCCNGKGDIAVGIDKRRYAIFYTPQQSAEDIVRDGMSGQYFPQLYRWLRNGGYAIVNDFLRTYAIPDELNPATMLHRAPVTSSTAEMLQLSKGPLEQEIMEAIAEGRRGFSGGWISSMALDKLISSHGKFRMVGHNRRREMIESLGYRVHPALPGGRSNNYIPMDNGRPRLYLLHDHPAMALTKAADVVDRYVIDQGLSQASM